MATGYTSIPSHSTHGSLEGYHHPLPHGLSHHPHMTQHHGQTCVPSLIPPGIDPAQVDIRTFYPYQPNEVKHRKRTTRPQLKVLENVYEHDTKPNALLRKKLAEELGMTPRGVQVWFQNRRAKEKNQAKKLDANLAATGTTSSTSSTPALGSSPSKADATTTSEDESPTASVSNDTTGDDATADSLNNGATSTASSTDTVRRSSLSTLPTVPAVPALEDASHVIGPSDSSSAVDTLDNTSEEAYLMSHSIRSHPSAAAILAQRRPSLPILKLPSSPNAIRRMPSNLSGKTLPKGFDPYERRKSVDTTMSANMRRLGGHPYAHLATQYTNGQSGFGHGLSVYGGSQGLHTRRSISHTGLTDLEEGVDTSSLDSFSSLQPPGRTYNITPMMAHGQSQHRPHLMQRSSMPSFHQVQQQQQPSPPSAASNGSFAGSSSFTDPWHSQSVSAIADTPISPHALPPPSPGGSAPPLPISQSFSGSMLTHSISRRHAAQERSYDQQELAHSMSGYAIPARQIPAPVPGPLPDAHFSFGLPSSAPPASSSSGSSPVVHDATLGMVNRGRSGSGGGLLEEEADDASAVSSTYDPRSRFGSFASVASTESSWTSAYFSDADGRKLSVGGVPDAYDPERRGSLTSAFLPQLFGELDVNSGCTPQPGCEGGVPSEQQPHPDPSRRGSSSSLHDQQAFSDAYHHPQDVYEQHAAHLQHDGYNVSHDQSSYHQHSPSQDGLYVQEHGSYSPSSTISARSQCVPDGKGMGNEHEHSSSPPVAQAQRSHSSELMYALHPSNGTESLNSSDGQLGYPTEYEQSLTNNAGEHDLSPHQPHHQYESMSPKSGHYPSHSYGHHQGDAYQMTQQQQQQHYASPPMEYMYQSYQGQMYDNGAVDLGTMCVPASLDAMHMGEYA